MEPGEFQPSQIGGKGLFDGKAPAVGGGGRPWQPFSYSFTLGQLLKYLFLHRLPLCDATCFQVS